VTWSLVETWGGSITPAGVYTAPSEPGTYHVVASSVVEPSVSGTVTVEVTSLDLLPAIRRTVWNPGIPGGVPSRTIICSNLAPSGGDDTNAIQTALNNCPINQVVKLAAGTYRISGQGLSITRSVVLRGSTDADGRPTARLVKSLGTNYPVIAVGTRWYSFTQPQNLASDGIKGNTSVTLSTMPTNPVLSPGEIVAIDQLTNPSLTRWSSRSPPGDQSRGWFSRFNRPIGQVLEIQSVSGNTVSFTTPLHIDFVTAYSAQLVRFSAWTDGPVQPATKYVGIEDVYTYGGEGGDGGGNIHFFNTAYSWAKNIESDYHVGTGFNLDGTFRCVLRDSYVHDSRPPISPGGGCYGIGVNVYASDNLIENNISWNHNKVMVMRASGGGNVIAYNYMDDGWISYAEGFVETGLNPAHMTTPHYELLEGNQAFNIDADGTWGNSIYITYFRNHATSRRRSHPDTGNRRAASLMWGHYWHSFLGNVLGYAGMSPAPAHSFVYETTYPWPDDPVGMWRLGYDGDTWGPADQQVISTVIREGNFDYATNQVHWSGSAQPLPPSLYLSGRPEFFGGNPWPWVDPTGATKVYTLPARTRFDSIHP
jgi:hypothetical protein